MNDDDLDELERLLAVMADASTPVQEFWRARERASAFWNRHARDLIDAARERDRLRMENDSNVQELHRCDNEIDQLRDDNAKLAAELSRVSSQLGQLQGSLAAVQWQGGPEKTVAAFREENERLRAERDRLRAALTMARDYVVASLATLESIVCGDQSEAVTRHRENLRVIDEALGKGGA